ncbi:MAG: phosphatidate cytidylyltransferase [Solidesulfovibrio sp.]
MHILPQNKRLLTAAVGLPVLAAAVGVGGWPLMVLVAAASVPGMREFFVMVGRPGRLLEGIGLLLGVAAVGSVAYGGWPLLCGVLAAAFWAEQLDFLRRFSAYGEKDPPRGILLAAIVYVPLTLRFLCLFSALETAFVLAVVMAVDTGAYYGGNRIGGPKIWPAVSPGKTCSGSLCGLLAGALVAAVFGCFVAPGPVVLAGLGAAMAAISQLGDFYESALKRAVGVKDSGALLPGHGGLLDRVDGLLPAILVYAAYRSLWGLG